ncbi:CAAX amino terminal protease family protein [Yersinia enterocolitica]|uniref:hypothetical protein n=1 Tax=Yersinia enterocolitica TaxID=630 RepID=UPI0005DDBD46|nr:hypothetical protein [Yersinia enterocolitica]CNG35104.1 CAAX amino terminal protease family protein [Yersinia enterocolitica]
MQKNSPRYILSLFLLALSLSIALYHGVLTLPSAAFLLLTLAVALLLKKYRQQKWLAAGLELLLVLTAIALFLHLIPGFNNLKVLDNVKVGPLSAAFSMYYNLDKALVPFILLACGLAWLWSGRLWVAVAFHFGLNLMHLLFFTYPLYSTH